MKIDLNVRNDLGETALHLSAALGHTQLVNILVRFGADVLAKDGRGSTVFEMLNLNVQAAILGKHILGQRDDKNALKIARLGKPLLRQLLSRIAANGLTKQFLPLFDELAELYPSSENEFWFERDGSNGRSLVR